MNWIETAKNLIPGGVNSPVRAALPAFFDSANGAYLTDTEGKRYIDYVGGFGPAILGHAHPDVIAALHTTMAKGLCFGGSHPGEVHLAQAIQEAMPHLSRIRFINSGTEACMTAIRLARGFTGRTHIVKCVGGYHGHADPFLIQAGSGALTLGQPSSPGIPQKTIDDTLLIPYNDTEALTACFETYGDRIAAVIVEPVAGNMGCIPPLKNYLAALRQQCDAYQSVLIFDEVMTGFRIAHGGAREVYGVTADLTTLGKIMGGGLPVGALGGREDIMSYLAPLGPVYQAGTLSGGPLTMAAGLATLSLLKTPLFYTQLSYKTQQLLEGIQASAKRHGMPIYTTQVGGMFSVFFSDKPVHHYQDATQCDHKRFQGFWQTLWQEGIYWPPSPYEAGFISQAHTSQEITKTLDTMDKALSLCHV